VLLFEPEGMRMNKDQLKGRVRSAKGKVKEIVGKIVGNQRLESKGKVQKVAGEIQTSYGDLKDDLKKGI
jgi:uncharacterized protein YjbJ (UPF0337 family)